MLKRLAQSIREYKTPSILTLVLICFEVVIEVLIPFITADLVNLIKAGAEISTVMRIGLLLIVMAILSLACGSAAGYFCAKASSGFGKNLREDLFVGIQDYSFENIDKFSSASL